MLAAFTLACVVSATFIVVTVPTSAWAPEAPFVLFLVQWPGLALGWQVIWSLNILEPNSEGGFLMNVAILVAFPLTTALEWQAYSVTHSRLIEAASAAIMAVLAAFIVRAKLTLGQRRPGDEEKLRAALWLQPLLAILVAWSQVIALRIESF